MLRICKTCSEEKDIDLFVFHSQCLFQRTYQCRDCRNKQTSLYNKQRRWPRSQKENEKNRDRKAQLVKHFGGVCHDCKQSFPDCVFDFHHLDPAQKDIKISLLRRLNEKLWAEISKCIMLCSNCHRIRHWYTGKETKDETVN